jgi:hypothetical protein
VILQALEKELKELRKALESLRVEEKEVNQLVIKLFRYTML